MKIDIDKIIFTLFFWGVILFPGLLMILNNDLGSNYFGVIAVSGFIIILKMMFSINEFALAKKTLINLTLISAFIFIHLIIAISIFNLEQDENLVKVLLSLISLLGIFLACIFAIDSLSKLNDRFFLKLVNNIFFFLIFIGLLSSIMIFFGFKNDKKMFFFTEPSHYALIVTTFYAYKISLKKTNIMYAIPLLIIALSVQNLSLIAGIVLAVSIKFLRLKTIILIPLILIPIFTAAVNVISQEQLDYYSQRLNVSEDSSNTSTLTLMSGYEQAYLALRDSYGFGYGLQRMGYPNDRGNFVDIIGKLRDGNTDSNLHDGGLFISKLSVEFGILGLFFFIYTMAIGIKNANTENLKTKFFSIVLIMSSMYFLLRGSGYFTPSATMIFLSIVALKSYKINKMV